MKSPVLSRWPTRYRVSPNLPWPVHSPGRRLPWASFLPSQPARGVDGHGQGWIVPDPPDLQGPANFTRHADQTRADPAQAARLCLIPNQQANVGRALGGGNLLGTAESKRPDHVGQRLRPGVDHRGAKFEVLPGDLWLPVDQVGEVDPAGGPVANANSRL